MKTPTETAKALLNLSRKDILYGTAENSAVRVVLPQNELKALATAYLELKENEVKEVWPLPLKLTDPETELVQAFRTETECECGHTGCRANKKN